MAHGGARQGDGGMASRKGREGFLPPLADQQGQLWGGQGPSPETSRQGGRVREGQAMALADQPPAALRDAGQESATAVRAAKRGQIFDQLAIIACAGAVGLPLIKGGDREAREGIAKGAPATFRQVPAATIKTDQPIR